MPNAAPPRRPIPLSPNGLAPLFEPASIAVVGASDVAGSLGCTVMSNVAPGRLRPSVYAVSSTEAYVGGRRTYGSIDAIQDHIDLAVLVTPLDAAPRALEQCGAAGVPAVVLLTPKGNGVDEARRELEQQALTVARRHEIRLLASDTGVAHPGSGLNATSITVPIKKGNVGFISQSGSLGAAIVDWSQQQRFGFSAFVSLGHVLDVRWEEVIDYLAEDRDTKSIVIYLESLNDPHGFLAAARQAALVKPVILLKGRQSEKVVNGAGTCAALSDDVLDAACRRIGILRVDTIEELFALAEALALQPSPRGPRLSIVTNAGAAGILAADALIAAGASLAAGSVAANGDRSRPNGVIDLHDDADPDRYGLAIAEAMSSPESDGVLVLLTPQAKSDAVETAQRLVNLASHGAKPVLASWIGGGSVDPGRDVLTNAGIPCYPYPEVAARAFALMWRRQSDLDAIYETPVLLDEPRLAPDPTDVRLIAFNVAASGRRLLTELEAKQILGVYGIPVVTPRLARSADEAVAVAEQIGYPVVLKLHSRMVSHQGPIGIRLNLVGEDAVLQAFASIRAAIAASAGESAFEGVTVQPMVPSDSGALLLASKNDPLFGPVLRFGAGGRFAGLSGDIALGLPPLTSTLARRMMEGTRVYKAITAADPPLLNVFELERLLVRFSQLVLDQPWLGDIEINPIVVTDHRLLALDATITVKTETEGAVLTPAPVFRPYPRQYVRHARTSDGRSFTIRPIRPEDEPLLAAFHRTLSDTDVRQRYFNMMPLDARTAHNRLRQRCSADHEREIALVAESHGDTPQILGVARITRVAATDGAELAIVVATPEHRRGIGTALMKHLVHVARREGVRLLVADILADNFAMQSLCQRAGFRLSFVEPEHTVRAELNLQDPEYGWEPAVE